MLGDGVEATIVAALALLAHLDTVPAHLVHRAQDSEAPLVSQSPSAVTLKRPSALKSHMVSLHLWPLSSSSHLELSAFDCSAFAGFFGFTLLCKCSHTSSILRPLVLEFTLPPRSAG